MACNIEEIRGNGIQFVKDMIKGNAKNIVFEGDVAVFKLKGKKIRTKEQALAVAQKKQQAIEKWSEETFKSKRFGGWTKILDRGDTIAMEVGFPPVLYDAYKRKLDTKKTYREIYEERGLANEYVYAGQVFSSLEDMQAAMEEDFDYFPMAEESDINFNNYVNSKKKLLEKVETRLNNLLARRKYESDKNIKKEIASVRKIAERLEKEIHELVNSPNIFEHTISTFNSDLELISDLLSGERPNIEDIHTAEYMLSYFDIISDYSSQNRENQFVDIDNPANLDPEIKKVLDKLRGDVTSFKTKVHDAKKAYLLEVIENSPKIQSLYPQQEAEQIRDEILRETDDIGVVSKYFGTIDKQFTKQDSLLGQLIKQEIERSRSVNKSYAAGQIQRMNQLVPKVKKKLLKKGYGISWKPLNSLFSEVSYDLFYQTTDGGKRTGKLIGPYSDKWHRVQGNFFRKFNKDYYDAIMERDWKKMDKVLVEKYTWLANNTEFLDITKIPELAEDPKFERFAPHFNADPAYRESVIARIGKHNYERLIEEQAEKLEDYVERSQHDISVALDSHGVQKVSELPEEAQHSLNITLLRNSPFEFLASHKNGQKGRVDYQIGNTGNQYQSHLKFNSFFPKEETSSVNFKTGKVTKKESGYYDPNFAEIKSDPELLEFWEILNDSVTFMNMTLSDSSKRLTHNSLPHMEKFTTDILLDKDMGVASKISTLYNNTKDTIADMFSTKVRNIRANDIEEINKSGIQHIQDKIGLRYKTELIKLKTQYKGKEIPKKVLDDLREEVTHTVSMEQAFNLPVVIRAYLDMVSEYKSQKDSLPKISIFKSLYEQIRLEKSDNNNILERLDNAIMARSRKNGIQDKRFRANERMDHWFNKNIKNLEDKEYWYVFDRKFYNKHERELLEAATEEKKRLEEELKREDISPEEMITLEQEMEEIEDTIENLGQNYTLAEAYNTVINKFRIFAGLAWNLPSNITNRFQGWYSGVINDTGKYWTAGNFAVANRFITKKGLRYIPGHYKYKNEIKKTRLMVEKLNVIQDATNEIDRARNDSGFTGTVKKLNPFYLTEYTEWHNQTPQILSILMDETITDKDGNTVPIFDGTSFPAHRIDENGELVLKDQFATKENVETWQDFSNIKSADNKSKISDTIAILNGDYSRTGSTFIKKTNVGKTLMTFKTWLPNQIWQRFAYNQKSLALGKERFDGIYSGAYNAPKTTIATSSLLATGAIVGGVMGLGPVMGGLIAAGAIYGGIQRTRANISGGEEIEVAAQLSETAKAITKKMLGFPVNLVAQKDIVKAHNFNKLNITEAEKQNLMTIVNEIAILLGLALAKVTIKAMMGPNDDDEPKTWGDNQPNPYYGTNLRSDNEKRIYNLLENQLTKTINDISLYRDPAALFSTTTGLSGLMTWLDRVERIDGAVVKWSQGLDKLSTGPNAGESRLANELQRTFLPAIGQGMLGFERMMEMEFDKTEEMDSWFYSDYKQDRKKARLERSLEREKLTEYWKEEYQYDKLSKPEQLEMDELIKKKVNKEIKITNPYPERYLYDSEQKRLGSD